MTFRCMILDRFPWVNDYVTGQRSGMSYVAGHCTDRPHQHSSCRGHLGILPGTSLLTMFTVVCHLPEASLSAVPHHCDLGLHCRR